MAAAAPHRLRVHANTDEGVPFLKLSALVERIVGKIVVRMVVEGRMATATKIPVVIIVVLAAVEAVVQEMSPIHEKLAVPCVYLGYRSEGLKF